MRAIQILFFTLLSAVIFFAGCTQNTPEKQPRKEKKVVDRKMNDTAARHRAEKHLNARHPKPQTTEELLAEVKKVQAENPEMLNKQDDFGRTYLHKAIARGSKEIAEFLLENGVDPNKADRNGVTPLIWAAGRGRLEETKLLVEHGADVNAMENTRRTSPLFAAAFRGHDKVVAYLLEHGADYTIKNNRGLTALDIAREKGHAAVVKCIEDYRMKHPEKNGKPAGA